MQCPTGKYGVAPTTTAPLASCSNCSAGTYNSNEGVASSVSWGGGAGRRAGEPPACTAGTWSSPGATICEQCEIGTSNPSTGASSQVACTACAVGKYSTLPAQPSCSSLCPAGYAGTKKGGISFDDACAACPPGYFSANEGAANCLPCPAGHYASRNTSTACDACDFDTFLSVTGGTSIDNCTACPQNQKTTQKASVSAASCVTIAFACGPFMQPRVSPPQTDADCEPLVCPPWLTPDGGGFGCLGCPYGTYGSYGSCQPCDVLRACPGYLSQSLSTNASTLASPLSRRTGAALCSSASLLPPVAIQLTAGPFSFISIPPLSAIVVGVSVVLVLLTLPPLLSCCPCTRVVNKCVDCLKNSDSFALNRALRDGEPSVYRPSALGGACNIASVIAFLTFATVLTLRWAADNSVIVSTLDTASRANNPFSTNPPWATLTGQSLVPSFGASTSLQIRVFSESGLGCDVPTQVVDLGSGGEWTTSSVSSCGDGRSLVVFSCKGCSLSASASLSFKLPFTCQALFIEAVSVDATGVLSVQELPPRDSSALDNALLTSLTWTLNPMAAIFTDAIVGRTSRGFRLLEGGSLPERSVPTNGLLVPNTAAVDVTVNFVLQSTFSITTLSQKVSIAELMSSIVGLAGVMGAFRFLFQFADGSKRKARERGCCGRSKIGKLTAAESAAPHGTDDDVEFSSENPLLQDRSGTVARRNSSSVVAAQPGPRRKITARASVDDGTYFVNPLHNVVSATFASVDDSMHANSLHKIAPTLTKTAEPTIENADELVNDTRCSDALYPIGREDDQVEFPATVLHATQTVWYQRQENDIHWFESSTGELVWQLPADATVVVPVTADDPARDEFSTAAQEVVALATGATLTVRTHSSTESDGSDIVPPPPIGSAPDTLTENDAPSVEQMVHLEVAAQDASNVDAVSTESCEDAPDLATVVIAPATSAAVAAPVADARDNTGPVLNTAVRLYLLRPQRD